MSQEENKEKINQIKKKGSKQEVWDGLAECTSGGLKKEDLILNKKGLVVSKKLSENGSKSIAKNRKPKQAQLKEEKSIEQKQLEEIKEKIEEEEKKEEKSSESIEDKKEEIKQEPSVGIIIGSKPSKPAKKPKGANK